MKKNPVYTLAAICAALTLAGLSQTAHAAPMIDNFQGFTVGQAIHGNNSWVAASVPAPSFVATVDPANSNNMTLQALRGGVAAGRGIYKSALIPDGETLTLRFDFRLQGATNDLSIGMTALATPDLTTTAITGGPSVRVLGTNVNVFDGDSSVPTNGSLSTGIWYTLDMVIDNDAQSYSAFLTGGAHTNLQLVGDSLSTFAYRVAVDDSDLVNFAIRSNNNNATSNALLLDNIQIIPEPSTLMLLGLALGAAGLTARRKRSR